MGKIRHFLAEQPCHVMQRGNNRKRIFFDNQDYLCCLKYLKNASQKYSCAIHAYVLMTNHIHLLVTPSAIDGVSKLMQYFGRYYVQYHNKKYARTGGLWEGRFRASMLTTEKYLFNCYRYIELNPVRAGMVKSPEDYTWSSYRVNALGYSDILITPHELYNALALTDIERQKTYQELFDIPLNDKIIDGLNYSVIKNQSV